MNFLALLPIFSTLIERIFPDKEKQEAAKLELSKVLAAQEAAQAEADAKIVQAKTNVVIAEAQSESYAARNWRPHLMYSIMIMMLYNWVFVGILRSCGLQIEIVPIPNDMWTLLSIGVGGYVVGKSGENIMATYSNAKFNTKKYFDSLRSSVFKDGMTQEQVDAFNRALEDAKQ